MTDSALIQQAKLGDPEAIAALMNQSLQSKGLRAIVDRQGECLEVILEAERVPNRQALTSFVEKGISNLGIQSAPPITVVRVLGRQTGASDPAWTQELKLDAASARVIPIDPLSIQSETAPPPVAMPGIDDFSLPPVANAAAFVAPTPPDWIAQIPPATGADFSAVELEGLDDAAAIAEPDFLHELLSSSADLPADESLAPNDEGLLDFLNELSDTPSAEPFPDETAQDLSNFEGVSPTEEGNFQELFAESAEFSLESELEPWEDSSESLPGGEPDADLLDFLAASDPEPNVTTDFSPQLAEIHEFPDAASIDQLPENWLTETTEPTSGPLNEPPADFLTSLLDEMPNIPVEPLSAVAPELSVTTENWPEATPNSGEDLQQALVNPPLADPWAEELFTADTDLSLEPAAAAVEFSSAIGDAPLEDAPFEDAPFEDAPLEYNQPDYEVSSVGLNPESVPVEPPAESPTWIQPDAEATLLSESFPTEPVAETSTWIQPDELDETLVEEEGLPDFLLEPRLDLPETDPVEMTYEEALQQPDVLEATLTQETAYLESAEAFDPTSGLSSGWAEDQPLNLDFDTTSQPASAEPALAEWTAEANSPVEPAPIDPVEPEAASLDFWPVDQPESFDAEADFSSPEATGFSEAAQPLDNWIIEPPISEPESVAEPELAELSSFADQQPTDLSWTETTEDFAVEEMPPDFLLELENEFLTGDSNVASSEPGWTALEADLAAMDLTADQPDPADLPVAMDTETSAFNLEEWMGSEGTAPTDADAALLESAPALETQADLELLSETAEGTAVEPPENWLASLREPADLADLNDAEPELAVAAEPPVIEPSAHTPLVSEPVVSNVTQDELEAGLGDFREGFVEPLPSEFFEDETEPRYPDWRTDLGDPLTVSEDGPGAGYILEDSEEIMPAVVPPAETPDELDLEEPIEPRSSDWIFPAVLLTVCGLLAGWLGFSLFSARIGPRQPAPPPAEAPPAPEQAPPAAPSPTSAQPTDFWVSELPATLDRN